MRRFWDRLRGLRVSRFPEPWGELNEIYVGPAVCTEHLRAVPCRVDDETCIISEQPEDILMVHEYQRGKGSR